MPLVWISILFILGIIGASLCTLSANLWLASGLAFLLIAFFLYALIFFPQFSDNPIFRFLFNLQPSYFILLFFFFFGAGWYQYKQPNLNDPFHVAFYNDREYDVLVTGTLSEPPDYRDTYANLKLKVEAVDTGSGDLPARGLILARVSQNQTYEYGERVRLRGKLKTPPENEEFSYRDYLAREGVYSTMSLAEATILPGNGGNLFFAQVYKLKAKLLENIYRIYNDPEASLLAGILLGVDTGLTPELQTAFKNTGTAHIIAISGFNIAIIAGIFFSMFKGIFGEKLGAFLAILAIAFYTILVGADAAVMRAAFMGSISLFARQLGRRNAGMNALAAVAFLMALINPFVIWDVGFQLSFLATLGLILYAEPFSNFISNLFAKLIKHDVSSFTRFVNDNVVLTFAAQVTTIPIMAYHFKRISLISFVANPFILFVQPAVMVLGGLAALVSLFILPLGQLLAWIAWPFSAYTIRVVELFDRIPNGVVILKDSSIWYVLATYAALFAVTFNWAAITEWIRARGASLRAAAVALIFAVLFICTMTLWRATSSEGDGQLHVTFLDVGSANAVLIQTPEGRNILINGGASVSQLSDELGRRLPFFTKKLDWLVVASTNENDLAALPRVLERYPPDNVLWSGNFQASYSAQTLDKFFAGKNIPVMRAETGQKLAVGTDLFIQVISAGGRGSALLVEYKNFRAFLPIGLNAESYPSLENGKALGKVDVLLLADSGYAPSNPPEVIMNLNPKLVVLSVSAGDKDGLPSQEVLNSLEGYSLLRTDRSGWITVSSDGIEMRVEAERRDAPTPAP
ncbi:MAG: ComEC/Rec2 family competence protein [Anaerolineales bacterium]|nr:ComEC/Rec2 family competence protein [Anaerolineales bacterium]